MVSEFYLLTIKRLHHEKNMFGYMLLLVSITLFSCTKSNVMHDDGAANTMQMADKEANGGGPYVLNMVIKLSGNNEVPAVSTTTKGVAHLRVSASKKLYSKVIVQRLESGMLYDLLMCMPALPV